MTPSEMWLDQDLVTRRRRRLRAVLALLGVPARGARYDGSRVVAIVRDTHGVTVTGHSCARDATSYLRRTAQSSAVCCWLDLDCGGIQLPT